jgi:hypothetical protein
MFRGITTGVHFRFDFFGRFGIGVGGFSGITGSCVIASNSDEFENERIVGVALVKSGTRPVSAEPFSEPVGAEKVTSSLGREGRSVQPEKVDITMGKVSSPASKSRRVGGKLKKRVMGQ